MKTIEEVIKAHEICRKSISPFDEKCKECPYHEEDENGKWLGSYCGDFHFDVLHYLKEYRVVTDICYKHGIASVWGQVLPDPDKTDWDKKMNFDDAYDNDPLSWDELRTMEGKPVWVESSDSLNRRRWMFVGEWFDDDEMRLFDMGYDYPDYVSKNGYESGTWQAYRKERENETN